MTLWWIGDIVLLLAVLPLFLAWRSLPSYFYCAAFPIFIFLAAHPTIGKTTLRLVRRPFNSGPLLALKESVTAS